MPTWGLKCHCSNNIKGEKKEKGCGFFAYNSKLPAYSGAFLLTVDNFSFFTLTVGVFLLAALAPLLTVGAFLFASNKGLKGTVSKEA